MVAYLVCFDLGAKVQEQIDQVSYWLNFLESSLPLPPSSSPPQRDGKWVIFLVGLRSDLCKRQDSSPFQQDHINSWTKNWPRLPIFNQIFMVSSMTGIKRVRNLFNIVGRECDRIFQSHSVLIPTSYKRVLAHLQSLPNDRCFLSEDDIIQELKTSMVPIPPTSIPSALAYLHAIGRIVLFNNGMVCTNAAIAPKIAAKFVSPKEVRLRLLKKETDNVLILGEEEIGCLLEIDVSLNERLAHELRLMVELAVCFELRTKDDKLFYLFPSLSLPASKKRMDHLLLSYILTFFSKPEVLHSS